MSQGTYWCGSALLVKQRVWHPPVSSHLRTLQGTHHCRLADIVGAKGCTLVATLVSKRSKKSAIKILSEVRCECALC